MEKASLEQVKQLNDDLAGRMLDAIYDQRPLIWCELIDRAVRIYGIDRITFTPIP